MASPYLTKPIRTVEQVMAERLRRPVAVTSRPVGGQADAKSMPAKASASVAKTAEGGGD